MAREFVRFDQEVILAEIAALRKADKKDLAKLVYCIERYQDVSPKENPAPAMVESFDEGFLELRHENGAYKGRLLYYVPKVPTATEELVMLVVFRKQTWKTPKAMVNLAVKRMKADMERRKEEEKNK
jgi:phage-related protein